MNLRIIYADVLFAVNFSADFIALYFCTILLSLRRKMLRLVLAAAAGALYGTFAEILRLSGLLLFTTAVVFAALMCIMAFRVYSVTAFVKSLCVFVLINMLLGGAVQLIERLAIAVLSDTGLLNNGVPAYIFFFSAFAFAFGFTFVMRAFPSVVRQKRADVTIEVGENKRDFTFICDSGNLLCDPYSLLPVIILSKDASERLVGGSIDNMALLGGELQKIHLHYIPVKTASGSTLLAAVKPNAAYVMLDGRKVPVQAVAALDTDSGSTYNGTDGIFPYSLIENIR